MLAVLSVVGIAHEIGIDQNLGLMDIVLLQLVEIRGASTWAPSIFGSTDMMDAAVVVACQWV